MVIIYGRRAYGRVFGHQGEFAQTRFFHLYYLPLVPESSFWVTHQEGDSVRGFEIATCRESVIAAYLRWWGPILALAALASVPFVLGAVVTASIAAAIIYTWRWRSMHTARARRQSEGDALVFGTHCPPALMTPDMRQALRIRLEERWAKVSDGRAPEDMVGFGGNSEQRLLAYGLLRLAAVDHRDPAASGAADRILDGLGTEPLESTPYRGDAGVAFGEAGATADEATEARDDVAGESSEWSERTLCSFGSCVGVIGPSGACKACGKRPGDAVEPVARPEARPAPWWASAFSTGGRIAFWIAAWGMVALTVVGARALLPTTRADASYLAETASSVSYVEVVCDSLELVGKFSGGMEAYACMVGDVVLPIAGTPTSTAPGTTVVGRLANDSDEYRWPAELRLSAKGYLELKTYTVRRVLGVSGLVGLLVLITGALLVRRRARRLLARR